MERLLKLVYKLPPGVLGRLRGLNRFRWLYKLRIARRYPGTSVTRRLRYVLFDPELSNFTYEISNHDELADFVANALVIERSQAAGYVQEAEQDGELRELLRERTRGRLDRRRTPLYGRRLGWYALVRALKPALIVETGIHDGLGSVLLLRALQRNRAQGAPGRLISVDVDPTAGWLVHESLRGDWTPVYESTFTALPELLTREQVGMLVHDSDHTYECELFEFQQAVCHPAECIALVSDNAHATSALRDVCSSLGVEYRFYAERPRNHFYAGGGIGLAVVDRASLSG
jgi:hypothetical protein